jgi:hypothetical protein
MLQLWLIHGLLRCEIVASPRGLALFVAPAFNHRPKRYLLMVSRLEETFGSGRPK